MAVDPNVLKELQDWAAFRAQIAPPGDLSKLPQAQKDEINQKIASLTPDQMARFNGETLSAGAKPYAVGHINESTGRPMAGVDNTHFDPTTGQVEKNKGFWDLPESKWVLASMASAALPFALPALTGLGSGAAPAGLSASEAGAYGVPELATTVGSKSILGTAAHLMSSKAGSDMLGAAANGIGNATNAAANNRGMKAQMAMQADAQHELELQRRATEEQQQRSTALKNASYADYTQNRKPGPFNTGGLREYGPEQRAINANLQKQAQEKLATGPTYDTNRMSPLTDPKQFVDQYGNPSTMEKIGNWASPTMSVLSKALRFF